MNFSPVVVSAHLKLLSFYKEQERAFDMIESFSVIRSPIHLMILALLIGIAFLLSLDACYTSYRSMDNVKYRSIIRKSFWESYSSFWNQQYPQKQTRFSKVLLFCFSLFNLIIFAHLTNLISTNLVVHRKPRGVESLGDLLRDEFADYKLLMRKSNLAMFMLSSKTEDGLHLRAIVDRQG